jgi:hypothetical protein
MKVRQQGEGMEEVVRSKRFSTGCAVLDVTRVMPEMAADFDEISMNHDHTPP